MHLQGRCIKGDSGEFRCPLPGCNWQKEESYKFGDQGWRAHASTVGAGGGSCKSSHVCSLSDKTNKKGGNASDDEKNEVQCVLCHRFASVPAQGFSFEEEFGMSFPQLDFEMRPYV